MNSQTGLHSTLVIRVAVKGIVIYANTPMARYLGVRKETLVGCPIETVAAKTTGDVHKCLLGDGIYNASSRLQDGDGNVFEARIYAEGGVRDIILDPVDSSTNSTARLLGLSEFSSDDLGEDELRSTRQPEKRRITALYITVKNRSDSLSPVESQLAANIFCEEAKEAIASAGGTTTPLFGFAARGIFGAPRDFADHALRAVHASCELARTGGNLREIFLTHGKTMLRSGCGIWTGDALVGTFGSSGAWGYSALGHPPEMAECLARIARSGETLLPEATLFEILRNLPDGWEAVESTTQEEPDLSNMRWNGVEIRPLATEHRKKVFLIGRGVATDPANAEFLFRYLYGLESTDGHPAVPVLSVDRPSPVADPTVFSHGTKKVDDSRGQTLGRYRVLEEIGSGGMGKVWKATDLFGNTVAIKVLHDNSPESASEMKRFRREAEVMARLPHRNICRILEMGEFEGLTFIAMEYVNGITLSELLRGFAEAGPGAGAPVPFRETIRDIKTRGSTTSNGAKTAHSRTHPLPPTLPLDQCLDLFCKVCDAVEFAHDHGVLHRDLKPGNILLREDGEPLVADFGLAKVWDDAEGGSISISGHIVGTIQNMSPEQALSSKDVDEKTDVYSLGTILYQMVTGKRHFNATGNLVADIQALQIHEAKPVRSLNPGVSRDVEVIIHKCLRKDPEGRYRSVSALRADIERVRRGDPIRARPLSLIDRTLRVAKRHRFPAFLLLVSSLLLAAGAGVAVWKVGQEASARWRAFEEAGQARASASSLQRSVDRLRSEVEKQEAAVRKALQGAESTSTQLEDARKALQKAEADHRTALASNIEAEFLLKEKESLLESREQALNEKEEQMFQLTRRISELELLLEENQFSSPPYDPMDLARAEIYASQAAEIINTQLTASELGKLSQVQRSGQRQSEVFVRISNALDLVSRGLMNDRSNTRLWDLKGRLHLMGMEILPAIEAFTQAVASKEIRLKENKPDSSDTRAAGALLQMSKEIAKPSSAPAQTAVSLLGDSKQPKELAGDFKKIADVIDFLGKRGMVRSDSDPLRVITSRPPSMAEAALAIVLNSEGEGKIVWQTDEDGLTTLSLLGVENIPSLETLADFKPTRIKIEGAKTVHWESVNTLAPITLDLTGASQELVSQRMPYFNSVQRLILKNAQISDLLFLKYFPSTTHLDISGATVRNLSPVADCRRLTSVDASGVTIELLHRSPTSLRNLIVDPNLVSESVRAVLSGSRRLFIQKPGDLRFASAAHFFESNPPETATPDNN